MKKLFSILITRCLPAIAVAAVLAAFCGCSRPKQEDTGKGIQIKGSDTMVNLGQAWAEAFMKQNTSAKVAVTGGGSGTGIAALIQGTADVAESSRTIKPEEIEEAHKNHVSPVEFKVGYDGIAVAVNSENPVEALTMEQLADVFSGKITNWRELGGIAGRIVVLSREVNSGTHVYFKEHVLNGGDSKGTVEFAQRDLLMPSSQAIADEVAQNPAAIGYVGMGYMSDRFKLLPIAPARGAKPVSPTIENVFSGEYPISRPLFFYTNGEPKGEVKSLVDFALSDEGQKIVQDTGFVPVGK